VKLLSPSSLSIVALRCTPNSASPGSLWTHRQLYDTTKVSHPAGVGWGLRTASCPTLLGWRNRLRGFTGAEQHRLGIRTPRLLYTCPTQWLCDLERVLYLSWLISSSAKQNNASTVRYWGASEETWKQKTNSTNSIVYDEQDGRLVSYRFCYKLSQSRWFKRADIYSPTLLEARSWNQGAELYFFSYFRWLLVIFGVSWFVIHRSILSCHHHRTHFSVCPSLCLFSYKDICHVGFEPTLTQNDFILIWFDLQRLYFYMPHS
jgi:hypothetical protein